MPRSHTSGPNLKDQCSDSVRQYPHWDADGGLLTTGQFSQRQPFELRLPPGGCRALEGRILVDGSEHTLISIIQETVNAWTAEKRYQEKAKRDAEYGFDRFSPGKEIRAAREALEIIESFAEYLAKEQPAEKPEKPPRRAPAKMPEKWAKRALDLLDEIERVVKLKWVNHMVSAACTRRSLFIVPRSAEPESYLMADLEYLLKRYTNLTAVNRIKHIRALLLHCGVFHKKTAPNCESIARMLKRHSNLSPLEAKHRKKELADHRQLAPDTGTVSKATRSSSMRRRG